MRQRSLIDLASVISIKEWLTENAKPSIPWGDSSSHFRRNFPLSNTAGHRHLQRLKIESLRPQTLLAPHIQGPWHHVSTTGYTECFQHSELRTGN